MEETRCTPLENVQIHVVMEALFLFHLSQKWKEPPESFFRPLWRPPKQRAILSSQFNSLSHQASAHTGTHHLSIY